VAPEGIFQESEKTKRANGNVQGKRGDQLEGKTQLVRTRVNGVRKGVWKCSAGVWEKKKVFSALSEKNRVRRRTECEEPKLAKKTN